MKKVLLGLTLVASFVLSNLAAAEEYSLYTKGAANVWLLVDGKVVKRSDGKNYNTVEEAILGAYPYKMKCPKCVVKIHVEDFEITANKVASSSSSVK